MIGGILFLSCLSVCLPVCLVTLPMTLSCLEFVGTGGIVFHKHMHFYDLFTLLKEVPAYGLISLNNYGEDKL